MHNRDDGRGDDEKELEIKIIIKVVREIGIGIGKNVK